MWHARRDKLVTEWIRLTLDHPSTSRKIPSSEVLCEASHYPQPGSISLLGISFTPRKCSLAKSFKVRMYGQATQNGRSLFLFTFPV